jgi:hypothetical protein
LNGAEGYFEFFIDDECAHRRLQALPSCPHDILFFELLAPVDTVKGGLPEIAESLAFRRLRGCGHGGRRIECQQENNATQREGSEASDGNHSSLPHQPQKRERILVQSVL